MAQAIERFDGDGVFSRLMHEARPPQWHCLRARSRHALILARELEAKGFAALAPVSKRAVTFGDTTVRVDVPVFGDLLLVFATHEEISALAAAGSRVLQVVEVPPDAQTARDEMTIGRARLLLRNIFGAPSLSPDDGLPGYGVR